MGASPSWAAKRNSILYVCTVFMIDIGLTWRCRALEPWQVIVSLDVEPARFFVHRHIRPQYACRPCETVSAAPIPPAVIDSGMAAVGLMLDLSPGCKLVCYRIKINNRIANLRIVSL
jgi:hypothetical protein